MATAATNKDPIFNCDEIITACEAALEAGRPLSDVFSISDSVRPGPNSTRYMNVYVKINSKFGRLKLRVKNEKHVGQIPPLEDSEATRMNAERNNKYGVIKSRNNRHPTLNVQEYSVPIETDDKGNIKGSLPDEDKQSKFFRVCYYLNEYFHSTMQDYLTKRRIIQHDARLKNNSTDAIIVHNTTIVPLYQSVISLEAKVNAGVKLANPICRITMKFDADSGAPTRVQFFDYTHPLPPPKYYEQLTFDGQPVMANNVHRIKPHSLFSGIVSMDSICISKMGISIPITMHIVIIQPPIDYNVGIADVFESETETKPSTSSKPKVSDQDLAEVFADLSV